MEANGTRRDERRTTALIRKKDAAHTIVPPAGAADAADGWLRTRHHLARTRLDYAVGGKRAGERGGHASVVARRNAQLAQRRRRLLTFFVIASAILFPPLLVPYLVAWVVVRNKPANKSMRRVREGVKALEKERIGIALQRLQEAHLLDPSNDDALYWLGLLLADQRRHDESVEALTLLSERVPGLPEVEAALLDAHHQTGDAEAVVHHAQRLLDLDPYNLDALVKLADGFEALGRPALAIETLRHAPLYKRTLDEPLKRVHYRLATLYERHGDPSHALEHYRRLYAADVTYMDVGARLEALERNAV